MNFRRSKKNIYYIFFSADYRRLPFWSDTEYSSNNGAFNCFRKLATGKRRDANSIGKEDFGGDEKASAAWNFAFGA